jgi:hypothetical protein
MVCNDTLCYTIKKVDSSDSSTYTKLVTEIILHTTSEKTTTILTVLITR